jgi:hypothetical protein
MNLNNNDTNMNDKENKQTILNKKLLEYNEELKLFKKKMPCIDNKTDRDNFEKHILLYIKLKIKLIKIFNDDTIKNAYIDYFKMKLFLNEIFNYNYNSQLVDILKNIVIDSDNPVSFVETPSLSVLPKDSVSYIFFDEFIKEFDCL